MTAHNIDAWIPEDLAGPVIQKLTQLSAVERLGRPVTMTTQTREFPRSGGMGMDALAKGDSYTEDDTTDDSVTLRARKFGKALSLDDDDLADADSIINALDTKKVDWATAFAKGFDNACLAVTAAESMTGAVNAKKPFTSIYKLVRTSYSDLGYTADTNYTASGTGGTTYDNLNAALGLYEDSDWYDEGNTVVIASPRFRKVLRGIKDDNNNPIFVAGAGDNPDTLFNYPIAWSLGARTSASMTPTPTGNPLLIIGNRGCLLVGRRSGPETFVGSSATGVGWDTDETKLKIRARRGFGGAHPLAFSVLEHRGS